MDFEWLRGGSLNGSSIVPTGDRFLVSGPVRGSRRGGRGEGGGLFRRRREEARALRGRCHSKNRSKHTKSGGRIIFRTESILFRVLGSDFPFTLRATGIYRFERRAERRMPVVGHFVNLSPGPRGRERKRTKGPSGRRERASFLFAPGSLDSSLPGDLLHFSRPGAFHFVVSDFRFLLIAGSSIGYWSDQIIGDLGVKETGNLSRRLLINFDTT